MYLNVLNYAQFSEKNFNNTVVTVIIKKFFFFFLKINIVRI